MLTYKQEKKSTSNPVHGTEVIHICGSVAKMSK
jgi:hypothetical protein